MSQEKVSLFLEELSYKTNYCFLEEGKDKDELVEIAKKYKISVPSKDIAIFKGKYAFVNEKNRNGCTLPKEEVEKSLKTLNGKPVDKDHYRKNTLGYWFGAELENETIVSYGAFWKSNFPEDYEEVKKRMSEGKMKISFEAWGDREFKEKGGYNLTNIEFAGGALLFDTKPAFDRAEVLEFAKVMTDEEKNNLFTGKENEEVEEAKLRFAEDDNMISRICYEEQCPFCEMKSYKDIQSIDFENSKFTYKCGYCGSTCETDLTPKTEIKKRGKKPPKYKMIEVKGSIDLNKSEDEIEEFILSNIESDTLIDENFTVLEDAKKLTTKERKNIKDELFAVHMMKDGKKIRMFPMHDPAHVRNALARLPQAKETLNKLGIDMETVKRKILKRAKELKMMDLVKRHEKGGFEEVDELLKKYNKATAEEFQKFVDELVSSSTSKDSELATLKASLEESKKVAETATAEAKTAKEALNVKIEAEKAALVKARREELEAEFAKDLKDEDLLDETKFELAKTKKELAKIKAQQPAKGGLEAGGTKDKDVKTEGAFKVQKSITELAFAQESND